MLIITSIVTEYASWNSILNVTILIVWNPYWHWNLFITRFKKNKFRTSSHCALENNFQLPDSFIPSIKLSEVPTIPLQFTTIWKFQYHHSWDTLVACYRNWTKLNAVDIVQIYICSGLGEWNKIRFYFQCIVGSSHV